jgi:hypothetical protein
VKHALVEWPGAIIAQDQLPAREGWLEFGMPGIALLRVWPDALEEREITAPVEPKGAPDIRLVVPGLDPAEGHVEPVENVAVLKEMLEPFLPSDGLANAVDHPKHHIGIERDHQDLGMLKGMAKSDRVGEALSLIVRFDPHHVPAESRDVAEQLTVRIILDGRWMGL